MYHGKKINDLVYVIDTIGHRQFSGNFFSQFLISKLNFTFHKRSKTVEIVSLFKIVG